MHRTQRRRDTPCAVATARCVSIGPGSTGARDLRSRGRYLGQELLVDFPVGVVPRPASPIAPAIVDLDQTIDPEAPRLYAIGIHDQDHGKNPWQRRYLSMSTTASGCMPRKCRCRSCSRRWRSCCHSHRSNRSKHSWTIRPMRGSARYARHGAPGCLGWPVQMP